MEMNTVAKPRPPIWHPCLILRQTCARSLVNTLRPFAPRAQRGCCRWERNDQCAHSAYETRRGADAALRQPPSAKLLMLLRR